MYEAVQLPGRVLYLISELVVAVHVEDVGDEVEGILVVADLEIEACEVEAVGEIIFVDLTEVLVALGGEELGEAILSVNWLPIRSAQRLMTKLDNYGQRTEERLLSKIACQADVCMI